MANFFDQFDGVVETPPEAAAPNPLAGRSMGAYVQRQAAGNSALPEGLSPRAIEAFNPLLQSWQKDGLPVTISSGYRDPTTNQKVGGANGSQHLTRNAIDIPLKGMTDDQKQRIINDAQSNPMVGGFGYYPKSDSIHLDVREGGRAAWGQNYSRTSIGQGWPEWLTKQTQDWHAGRAVAARQPTQALGLAPEANAVLPPNAQQASGNLPPETVSYRPGQIQSEALPPPSGGGNFFDQFDDPNINKLPGAPITRTELAPPSQAANLAASLKGASAPLAQGTNQGEALLEGGLAGASGNWRDEIYGASEASGLPHILGGLRAPVGAARIAYEHYTGQGDPSLEDVLNGKQKGTATQTYELAKNEIRDRQAALKEEHPGTYLGGQVLGAVALPAGKVLQAPTLGGRIVRGAGVGGVYGAVAGAGEGEGLTDRLEKGAEGGALGVAVGGVAPAAIEGVVKGVKKLIAPSVEQATRPKASDIFSTSKPYYRAFKEEAGQIEIPPETAGRIAEHIRGSLTKANLIPELAPSVYSAVGILEKGEAITLADLQNVKRVIGRSFSSSDKNIRDAAAVASGEVSKLIGMASKSASENLRKADAIHSTARSVQDLQRKADVADLRAGRAGYGGNAVNSMRQVLSPIVQRAVEGKNTGFKPDEIQAMREIVEGTTGTNAARGIGQFSPSKGIIQTLGAGGAAFALGPAAFAIPAIGAASNKLATVLTGKQIEHLQQLVAKRSPAYAEAVKKSAERYGKAQAELLAGPTPARFAAYAAASRALSSGLSRDGLPITSGQLMRLPGGAHADENEPEIPRPPGQ